MKTSELIRFFANKEFADEQGYNLLVSDLYDAVPEEMVITPAGQRVIGYFLYKIQQVMFPAIRLKKAEKWVSIVDIQGWWWHWDGSEESSPFIYHIMCSRSSAPDRFFIDYPDSRWCDEVGGLWMKIDRPVLAFRH